MKHEMRGIAIAAAAVVAGCSSKSSSVGVDASHPGGDAAGSGAIDAPDLSDAPPVLPDAPDGPRPLYVLSGATLYKVDVLNNTSTMVAAITSNGTTVEPLAGLGFDGANLIGLDSGAANLLVIDPDTAVVTAERALSQTGLVGGLTVIRPNEIGNPAPIFLAASADTLYRIAPATGDVTAVGAFADGMTFASDLAWLHGKGLYITLHTQNGPTTNGVDLVQIDPTDASTVADLKTGYNNINGLSGYHDHLWGVSQGGNVYAIDPGSGTLALRVAGGPPYTEAAQ